MTRWNRGSILIKGYLVAFLLLALGLTGVGTVALQASRSLDSGEGKGSAAAATKDRLAAHRALPRERLVPRRRARVEPRAVARDAGVPGAGAAGDAGPAKATPDAGAPAAAAAEPPPVMAPTAGPPRPAGPEPVLVIQFEAKRSHPSRTDRRAVRHLVDKYGYKDVDYNLTAYAAERHKPRYNKALARRRCRHVSRLIRKRGVSRRWIHCQDPVYRKRRGTAKAADLVPAWRRVEIRAVKR